MNYFLYIVYNSTCIFFLKSSFISLLNSKSFVFNSLFPTANISTANIPALYELFIATVATGIDLGICTIENSASKPSTAAFIGTPITGKTVFEAITPGKCAASPAPAMITP